MLPLAAILALTLSDPHVEEIERAAQVCDVATLRREAVRLRVELTQHAYEPDATFRIRLELKIVWALLDWCAERT